MNTNAKGFSLVEMAIVLVIFGLILASASSILSLFVNKGGAERTRKMIESDKRGLYSYVASNLQLPSSMTSSVTYPNDAYNKNFYYYSDPILNKTYSGWSLTSLTDTNSVCGSFYTNTAVKICGDSSCSDTNATTINNVAFVIISGSANKNIQTSSATSSGITTFKVYQQGTDAVDDYTTDLSRKEKYDDIVDWVTLDELRSMSGCSADRFTFMNTTMPAALTSTEYAYIFYLNGGIPYYSNSENEYDWYVSVDSNFTSNFTAVSTNLFYTVNKSGTKENGCTADGVTKCTGAYLKLDGNNSGTFSQSTFQITVSVVDKAAYAQNSSSPTKYTRTFVLNAQQ